MIAEARICVIGAPGSGKSALVVQYVSAHFVEDYDPDSASPIIVAQQFRVHSRGCEVEDSYRKGACIDDEAALLDILYAFGLRSLQRISLTRAS